jgi:gliding motility-associated-like protein
MLMLAGMLCLSMVAHGQLVVQGGLTPLQLAQIIAGPGITVSNATITGSAQASGSFDGANSNIGLPSGVILTTGPIDIAVGPNTAGSAGTGLGLPGNAQLNGLAGATTYDAILFEFDFIPLSNTVEFNYVFGSEEYPEFVNSGYNDAFAFFISGPGIAAAYGTASYNMARVPGTTQPVTIDNVNAGANNQYYFNNSGGTSVQYDAFTRPLVATAQVQACQTYHIVMTIADAGDGIYDSGVFIEEGSLISNALQIEASTATADSTAYEGCSTATVTFTLGSAVSTPTVINYSVLGTATNGVDYATVPTSVTIPANQLSTNFQITPTQDGLSEGLETIIIDVQTSVCGTDAIIVYLSDLDPLQVQAYGDTSFCPGGTAMLWAEAQGGGGSTTFAWSNGATTDTIYVTPAATTDYTVSVTDYCTSGSPVSAPVNVAIALLPVTVQVFGDTAFCPGGTAMLWAEAQGGGGAPTIAWSTGETTDTIYVSPAATTQYTVTADDYCGANNPVAIAEVTIDQLPVADAGADQTYCTGDEVTLTASGGDAYEWFTLPAMALVGTDADLVLNPSGDLDHLLVAYFGVCSDTDTVAIFELPADPISAMGDAAICPADSTQLDVNGASMGSTFSWTPASGLSDASVQNPMASPSSTTWYQLTAVSANGCIGRDSVQIIVLPLPQVNFTSPIVCLNEATPFENTSTIASGSIATYAWDFGDGTTSAQTAPVHLYMDALTYTATLVATSAAGCVDSVSQDVTVAPLPVAAYVFTSDCVDKLITFTDNSSVISGNVIGWLWDFDNGNTSSLQDPPLQLFPSSGLFDVQLSVITELGCVDDTSISVEIYPLPTAIFTWDSVCHGLQNQFTDVSLANGAYPIDQYDWQFSDGQTSMVASPQVVFATPGFYQATLSVTTTMGCRNTVVNGDAVVYPNPVAQFSSAIANCFGDTTYFEDLSVVQDILNDSVMMHAWDLADAAVAAVADPDHVYSAYGFYPVSLAVTTDKGCIGTVTHDVEIYPLPQVGFTSDVRSGCQPLRIQFLDETTIPVPYNLAQWQWDLGVGNDSITTQFPVNTYLDGDLPPLDSATYAIALQVTSGNGCVSSISINDFIVEYPKPTAFFDADPAVADMNDPQIEFIDASSIDVIAWDWEFGDGNGSDIQHPQHLYADTGSYPVVLYVATEHGCLDTANYIVEIRPTFTFYIPNTFTPNNDGHNETFYGQGTGLSYYSMMIFDRWGEMIFESNDEDYHWDGSFQGQQVQQGAYAYLFTIKDWEGNDHHYDGHVILMR